MKLKGLPYASRMIPYSPAARGIIASKSAYVSAPASESKPAKTQTISALPGVPTLHVITRAFRNTPVTMMLSTLTEMAAISPRPRTSCVCSFCIIEATDCTDEHGLCLVCVYRVNLWLIPGIVGDQIVVSIATSNQIRLAVATDQDRSGEWPSVVVKHLRQRVSTTV